MKGTFYYWDGEKVTQVNNSFKMREVRYGTGLKVYGHWAASSLSRSWYVYTAPHGTGEPIDEEDVPNLIRLAHMVNQ